VLQAVTIRRGTARDVAATAELYVRARERGAETATIPPLIHDLDDVMQWMGRQVSEADCWLAQDSSGSVVGLLLLDGNLLDQLYVDPNLTGKGIGSQLMAVAKRERPEGLRLWTFASNEGAQRFYVRHGFAEVLRTDGSRNEERAPDIQYAWRPDSAAP
jgi:GNAT superfamily N-acetyltransferase